MGRLKKYKSEQEKKRAEQEKKRAWYQRNKNKHRLQALASFHRRKIKATLPA